MARKPEVDHTIHDQLAMKLCTEALRFPDSNESKVYLKALLQLNMSFANQSHTRDLHTLTRKLLRNMKDRTGIKLVEQFEAEVQKHLKSNSGDSADSADDTAMDTETASVVNPPSSPKPRKPRIRQLGSKNGLTLLMDATGGSDAEISQSSDVFFSPENTSTQREKVREKSPEVVIEVDSR